ncbi:capsid protein [Leptospira levettii]|uniref:capsid protein n=1 Tax=Leptospira levettii TaxID=2023178 RepID=UPI000C2A3526|nr:capsid protein [Leptospira levettii]PJZ89550.1 hypothetical protein CH368_06220 [Leptospira levettii]
MQTSIGYDLNQVLEIRKAFEANTASGGASPFVNGDSGSVLSRQFLDGTWVAMVSGDDSFSFLKQVPKRDIKQVLAEYNVYRSHGGGWYDTSYTGQSGEPNFKDAILKRAFDEVAYLRAGFSFNKVSEQIDGTNDPEVVQGNAALRRMTESNCRGFFFGDKTHNPFEQIGFWAKLKLNAPDCLHDARGQLVGSEILKDYSARIATQEFGKVNDLWMHHQTKVLYDQNYEILGKTTVWQNNSQNPGQVSMSNVIDGINDGNALNSKINFKTDLWLDRHQWDVPKVWNETSGTFVEGPTSPEAPNTPSIAVVPIAGPVPGSKFGVTDAGNYDYRVSAGNFHFHSQACAKSTVTIPANGGATITITPAGTGPLTTEFTIFRSVKPGSTTVRFLDRILRAATPTTVYTDLNELLPGTTIMILGDFNSRSNTAETRTHVLSELLPPFKTVYPYGAGGKFVSRFGVTEAYNVLQIMAERKFRVIYNVPVLN